MTLKKLLNMQINEEICISTTWVVLRVPGGWIYTRPSIKGATSVFVPYQA